MASRYSGAKTSPLYDKKPCKADPYTRDRVNQVYGRHVSTSEAEMALQGVCKGVIEIFTLKKPQLHARRCKGVTHVGRGGNTKFEFARG